MLLESIIHFNTYDTYNEAKKNGEIPDASLAFCKESKLIFTHGQEYDCQGQTGTVLYETTLDNINFDTVTLSDDLANYRYVEVYSATDDKHCFYQKVVDPNDKNVSFQIGLVGQNLFFMKSKVYYMSGTSISTATVAGAGDNLGTQVEMAGLWRSDQYSTFTRGSEFIGIYKVIGYK